MKLPYVKRIEALEADVKRLGKACWQMGRALSRIDYLCSPPNEYEVSEYDVHCDEGEVVKKVEALREENRRLREADNHPWYGLCDGFGPNGTCAECNKIAERKQEQGRHTTVGREARVLAVHILEEDKRICEAATAGSLEVEHDMGELEGPEWTVWDENELPVAEFYTENDARFFAKARTGWPVALEEIERLRKKLVEERADVLWGCYKSGIEAVDGKWDHMCMPDGEWLAGECGFDPRRRIYDAQAIKDAIPLAAKRVLEEE